MNEDDTYNKLIRSDFETVRNEIREFSESEYRWTGAMHILAKHNWGPTEYEDELDKILRKEVREREDRRWR